MTGLGPFLKLNFLCSTVRQLDLGGGEKREESRVRVLQTAV